MRICIFLIDGSSLWQSPTNETGYTGVSRCLTTRNTTRVCGRVAWCDSVRMLATCSWRCSRKTESHVATSTGRKSDNRWRYTSRSFFQIRLVRVYISSISGNDGIVCPPSNFFWIVNDGLVAMTLPRRPWNLRLLQKQGIKHLVPLSPETRPTIHNFPYSYRTEIPTEGYCLYAINSPDEFYKCLRRV
jgi:hypothetical protein